MFGIHRVQTMTESTRYKFLDTHLYDGRHRPTVTLVVLTVNILVFHLFYFYIIFVSKLIVCTYVSVSLATLCCEIKSI